MTQNLREQREKNDLVVPANWPGTGRAGPGQNMRKSNHPRPRATPPATGAAAGVSCQTTGDERGRATNASDLGAAGAAPRRPLRGKTERVAAGVLPARRGASGGQDPGESGELVATAAGSAPTGYDLRQARQLRENASVRGRGDSIQDPGFQEKCGVVALYAPGSEPARLAFFSLYALQHRGQESAGICTADGESLRNLTGMGLVSQVFHERDLVKLGGAFAIGHTRYSTTGASRPANAQPLVVSSTLGSLALAHNGNLANLEAIRLEVTGTGVTPRTSTDSELIAHLIAQSPGETWLARMRQALPKLQGAFCLVMLACDQVFAARDPWGIRPLALGRLPGGGWVSASESCALDTIGATFIREVAPGELVSFGPRGVHAEQFAPPTRRAACSFEHIYFSRPDSVVDGRLVYATRERLGEELAREHPVQADFVMPVPDSATPAAIGFSRAAHIPYREGLVKNRYIGRTFIQPHQQQREAGVDLKFNPLPEVLRDRRIALVDDSIVRGTTTPRIVAMLRRAGAAEVHLRICAPPIRYACHLGVDTAPEETLIANTHSVEEITRLVGADSLGYLSLDGLVRAIGLDARELCNACFHGRYPMPIEALDKLALEPSASGAGASRGR